jgi:hypothetical protein
MNVRCSSDDLGIEVKDDKHSALPVYLQKWKQKKLVGSKANEVKHDV